MSWALKTVAISVGVVLFLVIAAGLALVLVDWNRFRGTAESFLSGAAGREVTVGALDVDLGWTTRIALRDLHIANAEWATAGGAGAKPFVQVGEALLTVETLSLLGQVRLPKIVLRQPVINAARGPDGQANWDLGPVAEAAGEVAAPEEREEFPAIGELVVEDGRLTYHDPARGLDLDGTISTAVGETAGNLELDLEGSLEERPVHLAFTGGSLLQLRETTEPYPFELRLTAGDTEVSGKGTAVDPVRLEGVDIQLHVAGPSMADVFPIFGIPLPETAPYSLEGRLRRDGQRWRFTDFVGKVDDSDLSGTLAVDYTPERPYLEAVVESRRLDFHDLGGLVGLDPKGLENTGAAGEGESGEGGAGLLPDTPLDAERLNAMDMDVRLKGEHVEARFVPITALDMRFVVQQGKLRVEPLTFFVADGKIEGIVAIDAREQPPLGAADLAIENLDLRTFFQNSEFVQEMGGRFVGGVDLRGSGQSLADMLGTADGSVMLGMRDGSVSGLLVEAAGLDLVEALALLTGGDVAIGIRCGLLDATVTGGVARFERGVVDTTDSLLIVQGAADLGKEYVDVQIEAREKDFSLIDAAAPVRIEGPFSGPGLAIGGIDPLPFFEMGEQKDIDCGKLLAKPEAESPQ